MKRKKIIYIIFVFALLMSVIKPVDCMASTTTDFKLTATPGDIQVGSSATLSISGTGINDMYACEVVIQFDGDKVEFVSGSPGFDAFVAQKVEGSQLTFALSKIGNKQGQNGTVHICNLNFKGKSTGTASFTLKSVKIMDPSLNKTEYNSVQSTDIKITAKQDNTNNDGQGFNHEGDNVDKKDENNATIRFTKVNINEKGTAKVAVQTKDIQEVLTKVKESTGKEAAKVVIEISQTTGAKSYEFELPVSVLKNNKSEVKIELKTETATLVLPPDMLYNLGLSEKSEKVLISVAEVDKKTLDAGMAKIVGNRPIVDLNIKVDDTVIQWNNPDAKVTISIPYKPTAEELKNHEHLVVYYIGSSGTIIPVYSARYNPETGEMTMEVTHFSTYAVAYVFKTFNDMRDYEWARKQVEVMSAKGIIAGDGQGNFMPKAKITRADFLTILVKAFDLNARFDTSFDDIKKEDYYYQAVNVARKLGITEGDGNNRFRPTDEITRQDMMILCAKAMVLAGKMQVYGEYSDLEAFTDRNEVSDYAVKSVGALVKAGLIKGDGNKVMPLKNATRAEAAVLIYKMYNLPNY